MCNILKAEYLKLKHTFGVKIPIIAPCIMLFLAFVLTIGLNNAFPAGAWNWWYILFLSGSLSIICYLNIKKDKKSQYHNIFLLNISPQKIWFGKIIYCSIGLFISNIIIYLGTLVGGAIWGTTISPLGGLSSAILLTISYLWEVPLFLFLSAKFGMFANIFVSVILSVSGVVTVSDSNLWWTYPASIPIRLMCPTLGLLPNGLPIPTKSGLNNTDIILPGIVLSIIWFIPLTIGTSIWFKRLEEKE